MRSAMSVHRRMSPQERFRAAQDLRRRALTQPGLPLELRKELRRVAMNLVLCNMLEAKRDQHLAAGAKGAADRPSMTRPPD